MQAQSNLAFTEADFTRGQQLVRDKTITEQTFEQRSQAFRNAQGLGQRHRSGGAPGRARSANSPNCARRSTAASATAACRRATWSPAAPAATPRLLATIVSTDPIHFEFTFDEASFLRYERIAKDGGQDVASRGAGVQVALKLIDENDFDHDGRMDFVDNVIDRSTGTIRGRARVRQPERRVHARHVRARAGAGSPPYEALLVPDAAIGTEQARKYRAGRRQPTTPSRRNT